MKIYTLLLESNIGLTKIITHPERPDSDMELFFNNPSEKSIILNKAIWQYVQAGITAHLLGKDLAIAITKDYPHLFKKPLEFQNSINASSMTDNLFSHLGDDVKAYTETRLKKIDEQIARSPGVLKFKVDRADLLCDSGEFQRAKLGYNALSPLCPGDEYLKSKIKRGLSTCELELKKSTTIFQTPFSVKNLKQDDQQAQNLPENNTPKENDAIILPQLTPSNVFRELIQELIRENPAVSEKHALSQDCQFSVLTKPFIDSPIHTKQNYPAKMEKQVLPSIVESEQPTISL